jgi:hypothetical protein
MAEDIDAAFAFCRIPGIHSTSVQKRLRRIGADYPHDDAELIHTLSRAASTAFPHASRDIGVSSKPGSEALS